MKLVLVATIFLLCHNVHVLVSAAGSCAPPGLGLHFYNWDGQKTCKPVSFFNPKSEAEVSEYLRGTEGPVKVVGGGLSFSGIQLTDEGGHMVSLDRMNQILGVESLPDGGALVTVQAGIRLRELAEKLNALGLAMPNMGGECHVRYELHMILFIFVPFIVLLVPHFALSDPTPYVATAQQSFAGAAATGTHGTGQRLGGIATQVVSLRLVIADGTVIFANATENAALFRAAKTGLGALGVLTTVTLHVVPQWKMKLEQYQTSLESLLVELPTLLNQHPRLQWSWTPYTDNATVVIRTDVPWETPISPAVDRENTGCWVDGITPNPCTDISYKALTDSASHFANRAIYTEMEMFVPVERSIAAVKAFIAWMDTPEVRTQRNPAVQISAMLRYVAADDILLSPMEGRATAVLSFIAVQAEGSMEQFELYASGLQRLCEAKFQGRPHWGKVSYVDANTQKYLNSAYAGMQDFVQLAHTTDPYGRFSNSFLRDRIGL